MSEGDATSVDRRWLTALRAPVRAVREDLWTVARDPLPRTGWLGWLPHVHMVLLAVLLLMLNMNDLAGSGPMPMVSLLAAAQTAAPVVALFRPAPAWWLSALALFLVAHLRWNTGPDTHWPWTAGGIALHSFVLLLLSLRVRPFAAVTALGVTLLLGQYHSVVAPPPEYNGVLTEWGLICFSGAVAVGSSLRTRRVARERLVEQQVLTAGERARRTLLEERNRIARELHDVVAHHMSVISIQAQVAPRLIEDPPEALKENLAGIRENAVEALTELRRVLGVLRAGDAAADGVRHAPQPTLARLDELVANVRGAGLTVTKETTGVRRPLSPGVELSAFRIVQEALSNAMRHATGAAVRVELGYRSDALTLRITNTPPRTPPTHPAGAGHGLLGMRERAAMLGGELAAGRTPAGGWEVTAILPTASTSPAPTRVHAKDSAEDPV
ncbi:sensor histidine kinase [Streptomyces sp. NPDC019396]|uniref:sensor histidine kinase n=1 Tax=Streptomyces sp. NPDC019396 TaxID=3154687 RepID=UPI0033F5D44A